MKRCSDFSVDGTRSCAALASSSPSLSPYDSHSGQLKFAAMEGGRGALLVEAIQRIERSTEQEGCMNANEGRIT